MKKRTAKKASEKDKKRPIILNLFGERLRTLRKAAGYQSQEIFAYEHGFNRVRYNKWEQGEDIKLSNIDRIREALEITAKDFFGEGFG